jgi:hypothetical protein
MRFVVALAAAGLVGAWGVAAVAQQPSAGTVPTGAGLSSPAPQSAMARADQDLAQKFRAFQDSLRAWEASLVAAERDRRAAEKALDEVRLMHSDRQRTPSPPLTQ